MFLLIATHQFPTSHQEGYSILALNAGFKFCLNILYLHHQAQYFQSLAGGEGVVGEDELETDGIEMEELLEEKEAGSRRSLMNLNEVRENSYLLNLQHLNEKVLEELEQDT